MRSERKVAAFIGSMPYEAGETCSAAKGGIRPCGSEAIETLGELIEKNVSSGARVSPGRTMRTSADPESTGGYFLVVTRNREFDIRLPASVVIVYCCLRWVLTDS